LSSITKHSVAVCRYCTCTSVLDTLNLRSPGSHHLNLIFRLLQLFSEATHIIDNTCASAILHPAGRSFTNDLTIVLQSLVRQHEAAHPTPHLRYKALKMHSLRNPYEAVFFIVNNNSSPCFQSSSIINMRPFFDASELPHSTPAKEHHRYRALRYNCTLSPYLPSATRAIAYDGASDKHSHERGGHKAKAIERKSSASVPTKCDEFGIQKSTGSTMRNSVCAGA
jgi:hypothetical protein